jgi:hypothetical protein
VRGAFFCYCDLFVVLSNLFTSFFICVGTLLGRMPQRCVSLNRVILIRRKSSGQGFRLKGPRLRRPINLQISDGRIIALWFSGKAFSGFFALIWGSWCGCFGWYGE